MTTSFFFDAQTVSPTASLDPVPAGTYLSYITESSVNTTKDGSGQFLKLAFEVLEGQFKGRKIFNNLNIQNRNPDTQKYALADLSAICHATGQIKLTDTTALHHKPLKIKVSVQPEKDGYPAQNRIKGYESVRPGQMIAQAAPVANAPQAAPQPSNAPAWANKKAA